MSDDKRVSRTSCFEHSTVACTCDPLDCIGQEAFEQLRKLSYPGTDVFLIAYSTISRSSLNNIKHKWRPELDTQGRWSDAWDVVVGCKVSNVCPSSLLPHAFAVTHALLQSDLKQGMGTGGVHIHEAASLAKDIGAVGIVETSAKTGDGVLIMLHDMLEMLGKLSLAWQVDALFMYLMKLCMLKSAGAPPPEFSVVGGVT